MCTLTMETFEVSPWRITGIFITTDCPGSLGSFTLNLVSPNLIIVSKIVGNRNNLNCKRNFSPFLMFLSLCEELNYYYTPGFFLFPYPILLLSVLETTEHT